MGKKCLFTNDYSHEKMDAVRKLGYEVITNNEKGLIYDESMEEVEALICYNPFNTLDISKMKNLKWIQLASVGIDQLPMKSVRKKGIMVTNNRGGYSIPMGEWVVLKILELHKKSFELYKNQLKSRWKMNLGVLELYGKTVGFVGTGSIAVESAKRLQGFEVNIIGVNTKGSEVSYFDKCYSIDELDYMLPLCDVVVVAIPYTKKTHHLLDERRLNSIKKEAFLVNIARGSIIDEKVLVEKLKAGTLKGAALDVFEIEPLDENSPLWKLDNVILTPHNSWISERRNERRFDLIYKNLERYANGEKLINIVDLDKGY